MTKTKVTALIPVRMGSSRLPGKPMIKINKKPILGHLIDRIKLTKHVDEIVICTSTDKENDAIEDYCCINDVFCFRGDEDDVLGRLCEASIWRKSEINILVFGDCPIIDPTLIDFFIEKFQCKEVDFLSNDLKTTYPPGMEVQVFKTSALLDSANQTNDPLIREHGTLYVRQNPSRYSLVNIEAPPPFNRPELELEIDTKEDLHVLSSIMINFRENEGFTLSDIIDYLDNNKNIQAINQKVHRRWKSYRNDS